MLATAAVALSLSSTGATAGTLRDAVAPRHSLPTVTGPGYSLVQYTATSPAPLPWDAHLLSGTNAALSAASGPRALPDADGGTQVAYRNLVGDVIWMDGSRPGLVRTVDLTSLTGIAPLAGQPTLAVSPAGLDQVFCVTTTGHLIELTWDPMRRVPFGPVIAPLDLWTRTDLTDFGGPHVVGTPSIVVNGATTSVFARSTAGDLVEYVNDDRGGRVWSGYDLSLMAKGPRIGTDPAGFFDPATDEVRVAATELSPHRGDVVVYSPTDVGGRIWNFEDVTADTRTPASSAGVAAVLYGGDPVLLTPGPTGDLLEYTGDDAGVRTTWAETDLTDTTLGAPEVAGTPSATVSGNRLAIATVAALWGDLFEWSSTSPTSTFSVTDVSVTGQGPTRTVAGTPAAVFTAGVLTLYAAGVAVPAPEGTGVYSIPYSKWAQALRDGWPILGVTGGLGAQCAPWTQYASPNAKVQPDEYVGQVIQASHQRETWLSFWTVSGPGTQPSSACTAEKGPYAQRTFYLHGYVAGQWVARQIDAYRAAGLGLTPDWVLFDPEGYPDNHSGLWGPTSPPAKLARSVADYHAILTGWHNGLASVDPSLKAGLYANQYEYMTYKLYDQPLPTFVAGAFSEQRVSGKEVLQAPTRTAFGPNILGFIMYNDFTPTCTEVTNERLIVTEPPWDGDFNTVQMPPGKYCPPGPS